MVKTTNSQDDRLENATAQMRKGIIEYCILAILENDKMYASDIIARLKENKLIVVEGTLYPLLTRHKNAGLLAYDWEESKQGPPRKYYTLTENGKIFLNELRKQWQQIVSSVQRIDKS